MDGSQNKTQNMILQHLKKSFPSKPIMFAWNITTFMARATPTRVIDNNIVKIGVYIIYLTNRQTNKPTNQAFMMQYISMIHQWPMDRSQVSWFPQLPFSVPRNLPSVSGTTRDSGKAKWRRGAKRPRPLRILAVTAAVRPMRWIYCVSVNKLKGYRYE